jgi:hypothetical protein
MAEQAVETFGVNVPCADLNGPQVAGSVSVLERYNAERDLRLSNGDRAYIDPSKSEKFKHFLEDPWVENGTPVNRPVQDNGHIKALIVGGGFGGLLFAARLIQAGFSADEILIVEPVSNAMSTLLDQVY